MNLKVGQIFQSESKIPKIIISPPRDPAPAYEDQKFNPRHRNRLHRRAYSNITDDYLSPHTRKDYRSETVSEKPRISMKSPEQKVPATKPKDEVTKATRAEYSAEVCKCIVI